MVQGLHNSPKQAYYMYFRENTRGKKDYIVLMSSHCVVLYEVEIN